MSAAVNPQHGLFDREVEDGDLVSALEKRETLNDKRKDATGKYKEQHDKVKALLDAYDLGDEEIVRVGRFLIKNSRSEGRSVSFETAPSVRTRISLLGDDA